MADRDEQAFNKIDPVRRRQRLFQRFAALEKERASWDEHWKDIALYQSPRLGRFSEDEHNRGGRKDSRILDNTAIFSQRTLAAGMMAGMTSPARPWFRLALRDQEMGNSADVKQWMHDATQLLLMIFAQSNTYRVLHGMYAELGLFGTSAAFLMPDFNDVIRLYPLTVGEYSMACNYRGEVDTLTRKFKMTIGQMVAQFGKENLSATALNQFDMGNYDNKLTIRHIVQPRRDRDTSKRDNRNMRFESVYFEESADNDNKLLSDSGFNYFPALTPRWEVTGNDVYGSSPGMQCLGDVRQLQHEQLRKAQGIDYMVNPPLQVPSGFKEYAKARLPGGVFHVDMAGPNQGVRTAFEVQLRLDHLQADIEDIRNRIRSAYYADLFLMMANDTRTGITATEVQERHEEKMLMLGPVLERLHNEMLGPLVEATFRRCVDVKILRPPPPEIQGQAFDVEFVSTLAQAQKAISSGALDQVITRAGNLAQMKPEVLDKINADGVVDELVEMYGPNPKVINNDATVKAIRDQRAQQQQAAAAAAAAQPTQRAAMAAKTASEIDPQNMGQVMSMFQGYGA